MVEESIPNASVVIIDSSVLFAMGGPLNEKYQAFERYVQHQNQTVYVPQQVAEELCESPDAYIFDLLHGLKPVESRQGIPGNAAVSGFKTQPC